MELDIPLLSAIIPEAILNKKVNLNDDIKIDIQIEENSDQF